MHDIYCRTAAKTSTSGQQLTTGNQKKSIRTSVPCQSFSHRAIHSRTAVLCSRLAYPIECRSMSTNEPWFVATTKKARATSCNFKTKKTQQRRSSCMHATSKTNKNIYAPKQKQTTCKFNKNETKHTAQPDFKTNN